MSTPNTASSYVSLINQNFPVAGQDNSSQGFRNNFKNIKQALTWLDEDVYSLQQNSVIKSTDNDFNNNIIEKATFKDCSVYVYDDTTTSRPGDIAVDYEQGSYQKFKITPGFHTFTFVNWPDTSKTGKLTLSIISDSITGSTVDFAAAQINNLGSSEFPIQISGDVPTIFEVWNDGDNGVIFIQSYSNFEPISSTLTNKVVIGTNEYTTVTNSYAKFATVVKANNKAANLAVVPNKILATVINIEFIDPPDPNTSTQFMVNSTNGILVGATFDFPNSTSTNEWTVLSCTTDTVTVSPFFRDTDVSASDVITFVNPTFTDQPTLVTFKSTAQTTTTSVANDLKGTVYASSTTFWVAHADHSYGTDNWLKITADHAPQHLVEGSTAVTMTVTNTSTAIATTEFVKNFVQQQTSTISAVPTGLISLWYGSVASIPSGWALCNGSNGTPDLRDKFVIGASQDDSGVAKTNITGSLTQTGGTKDASVVSHTHTVTDPGHTHTVPHEFTSGNTGNNLAGGTGSGYTETTDSAVTGITIDSSGTSGTNQNLPPYYALCYIMKL